MPCARARPLDRAQPSSPRSPTLPFLPTPPRPQSDVGYINAHGTSTPFNDKFETMAIKRTFGEHARKLKISSTKSMTGHLLGAAGAIEAAISIKVLVSGDIPPTINLNDPDPELDLDYTPNVKVHVDGLKAVMTDNLGFGGHNAALLFTKYVQ